MPSWNEHELNTVRNGYVAGISNAEVAAAIGRSEAAVRGIQQRLGLIPKRGDAASEILDRATSLKEDVSTFEKDLDNSRNEYWRNQYQALESKYKQALKQTSVIEQLVERAAQLAPLSYQCAAPELRPIQHSGNPQSAVLLLSDTHVGQIVQPSQTLGFGLYNFDVFLARLKFVEDSVRSIIGGHTTTEVPELVICLGGDMLHGALNHSAEAAQHTTLFSQFYGAGHALAQFLRNLAPIVPKIRIQTAVGNHPRWGHQHKMPTHNRYSNLDHFLYAYVQALTREISSIEWQLDMQPFSLFDVQGFRFHLSHGDHLRGGDKALGIPNHAVGRMVSANVQLFGKHDLPAPHYYLTGHLHRDIALPHARGSFIVNGGFSGIDGYSLIEGFSPVDPTQTFFLVHPRYGRTAIYPIQLKFAEVAETPPYTIPEGFDIN